MRGLWVIAILLVVGGSLLPGNSTEMRAVSALHVNDKLLHFLAYAVLACLAAWIESRPAALVACLGLVALGILMEFLQIAVPGRSCELLDGVADTGGVLFGGCLPFLKRSRLPEGMHREPG